MKLNYWIGDDNLDNNMLCLNKKCWLFSTDVQIIKCLYIYTERSRTGLFPQMFVLQLTNCLSLTRCVCVCVFWNVVAQKIMSQIKNVDPLFATKWKRNKTTSFMCVHVRLCVVFRSLRVRVHAVAFLLTFSC